MPLYRITNRTIKETVEVQAPFAQDACERAGWMIGDCFVEMIVERPAGLAPEAYKVVGGMDDIDLGVVLRHGKYVEAKQEGDRRFGSACSHTVVEDGKCKQCLRRMF